MKAMNTLVSICIPTIKLDTIAKFEKMFFSTTNIKVIFILVVKAKSCSLHWSTCSTCPNNEEINIPKYFTKFRQHLEAATKVGNIKLPSV